MPHLPCLPRCMVIFSFQEPTTERSNGANWVLPRFLLSWMGVCCVLCTHTHIQSLDCFFKLLATRPSSFCASIKIPSIKEQTDFFFKKFFIFDSFALM